MRLASIARSLAALGELEAARAALAEARELASRIPGQGWSWERIHVVGALDALTLATAEDWDGMLAAFGELAGVDDPVLRWARAPMRAGYARTAAHLGLAERAMAMLAPAVRALTLHDFNLGRIQLHQPTPIPEDEARWAWDWMASWGVLDGSFDVTAQINRKVEREAHELAFSGSG